VDSFGDDLASRQEKEEEEEEDKGQPEVLLTSFMLGRGHRPYRHLDVVGNEIILASNRSPFCNITFTQNHWAHLMSALYDIDTIVKRLTATDENERHRPFACRRHLRDGYYVKLLFGLCCVDL